MPLTEKQRAQTAARQQRFRERQAAARAQELQRKGIPATRPIPSMPSKERWDALMEAARANIATAREEMQSYFEERSEEWQESDKGEAFQERLTQIEAALDALDET